MYKKNQSRCVYRRSGFLVFINTEGIHTTDFLRRKESFREMAAHSAEPALPSCCCRRVLSDIVLVHGI
jgi:hypothetical protein